MVSASHLDELDLHRDPLRWWNGWIGDPAPHRVADPVHLGASRGHLVYEEALEIPVRPRAVLPVDENSEPVVVRVLDRLHHPVDQVVQR